MAIRKWCSLSSKHCSVAPCGDSRRSAMLAGSFTPPKACLGPDYRHGAFAQIQGRRVVLTNFAAKRPGCWMPRAQFAAVGVLLARTLADYGNSIV